MPDVPSISRAALVGGLSTLLLGQATLGNPVIQRDDIVFAPGHSCTAEMDGKWACGSRTVAFQCDGIAGVWTMPPGHDCRTESQGQLPCCFAEDDGLNASCEARQGDGQCRESTPFG